MTPKKPRLLAKVTDFKGRTVAITQAAWNGHVLHNHPTMAFRLEDVKTTLQTPDLVKEDYLLGFRIGFITRSSGTAKEDIT